MPIPTHSHRHAARINTLSRASAAAFPGSATEADLHRSIVQWLAQTLPGALVHHSPNETPIRGDAGRRIAGRARMLGTVTGWPDLEIVLPGGLVAFLEIKASAGKVSRAQRSVHRRLADLRHKVALVRSVDDVAAAMAGWGVQSRAVRP